MKRPINYLYKENVILIKHLAQYFTICSTNSDSCSTNIR